MGGAVTELSQKNFGLLIAYVIPGFVALWGISHFSSTVASWITSSQRSTPTIGGFLYVTLASLAAGLIVSAVRWALVDTLHHATGVRPPKWDFAYLDDRLDGFSALVDNHYRYYQFYGNMCVAVAFNYRTWLTLQGQKIWNVDWTTVCFIVLELILIAGSRDALRKYYARAGRVLKRPEKLTIYRNVPSERSVVMTNGYGHGKEKSSKPKGHGEKDRERREEGKRPPVNSRKGVSS